MYTSVAQDAGPTSSSVPSFVQHPWSCFSLGKELNNKIAECHVFPLALIAILISAAPQVIYLDLVIELVDFICHCLTFMNLCRSDRR